ncbi:MAG: CHASE2 domain-containing protein, partial [Litorivicinus sp.]
MIFKRHWHQVWGAITLFGLLAWDPFGWMRASAYWVEDTYQKWMPIELPSSPVPVWFVEIDEAALVAYGQWPWPRTDLAEALIGLYERGASAVAIDVIQAEPDRTSPTRLASALGESVETLANEYGYLDWDEFLADVLKQTPTVLALAVLNDNHRTPNSKSAWAHIGPTPSIHNHSGSAGPIPVLADAAAGIGHVSISPDADGLVRR